MDGLVDPQKGENLDRFSDRDGSEAAMRQADRIRAFVLSNVITPARRTGDGQVTIRAGDVHRDMRLVNAMPAVCSVLEGQKFAALADVARVGRYGPQNGSNATFCFLISRPLAVPSAGSQPAAGLVIPRRGSDASEADRGGRSDGLFLIACAKGKRVHSAPARDLYTSALFTKARDYAETHHAEWRILSALHGLIEPAAQVDPYDLTLNRLGVAERRSWARRVLVDLIPLARDKGHVVFFAGERYREFLIDPLLREGVSIEVPMQGLRQGEQLAWLSGRR